MSEQKVYDKDREMEREASAVEEAEAFDEAADRASLEVVLDTIDDMALPAGKTCGDCIGWARCKAFIGSLKPTNTRCDWAPSAFRDREASGSRPTTGASVAPDTEMPS
jgi:hypothetical protein